MAERDWWKDITGKTYEETVRVPTFDNILSNLRARNRSKHLTRDLGTHSEGTILLTEEERESHLHILGTTGEGKSRLIEHLIRGDIKKGNGVCLLDPTDRGETAYNILRYCASIGFEKVCLIDPHTIHSHNRVACIQPFNYKKTYQNATVANLMDTVRVLFQTKDAADTPRIQRYLSAVLHVLWNAEMTFHEAVYFTDFRNPTYRAHRYEILSHSHPQDRHRIVIEDAFDNYTRWQMYFASTINRLEPFFDSTLDLMFGAGSGIDFMKMITEGWVILVNLYSGLGFEPIHTRLLGTTIINELIFALDRLKNRGWKGVYYLYIDEAGRYANRNLADLLAYKRKSGLRVTVAHQYFRQFEDATVLDAVKNLTKMKIMFDTPNPQDRLEMVRALGYGGDIPAPLAAYANSNLPKQTAIVKKPKQTPVRIKIVDVPDPTNKWNKKIRDEFVLKLMAPQSWYKTHKEIHEQFRSRFKAPTATRPAAAPTVARVPPTTHTSRSEPSQPHDRPPTSPTPISPGILERRKKQGVSKSNEKPKGDGNERPIRI
jgi:hypothetical protein